MHVLVCNPRIKPIFSFSFISGTARSNFFLNDSKCDDDDDVYDNQIITRRLKSFPWDALVYGSIMAFYLNLEKLGNRKDVSCYEHR